MRLFDGTFARGGAAAAVSDTAWLHALLEVEAALARAAARTGLVPATAAEAVAEACAAPERLDLATLAERSADAGNPVPPLVRLLTQAVGPQAAVAVHVGATSQDVVDTALVLLARRAVAAIEADLAAAADAAARLAAEHRDDVVMGRTLMQQALPTTAGLKAAGWLAGLDGARDRLRAVVAGLPVQYGGAVGTLAASRGSGVDLRAALAAELGLTTTPVPWATVRLPVADLAGALGAAAGVLATVALDVVLLAQSEVAEAAESGEQRGGSSAMPHKRNPVAAISARACARRAPGLVATLLAAMEQEHERAAGAWHSEWPTLGDLLTSVGSAAAWLADSLGGLRFDVDRMAATVAAAGDPQLAGALADALTPSLGRAAAHDAAAAAVREASVTGLPLTDVVLARGDVDGAALVADSTPDVGEAAAQVDAVLARHVVRAQSAAGPYPSENTPAETRTE
ncbi:3-carboxy-cis,cis-muconate cycloisomerase [Modestobacter sp. I12A-02628]|uniref:3-carboxy-cis,cis-muconate cycloisomerase n=1 Tax=Goekera deserti TaxID=2497753 RepID=A0A7K3WAX4_9ACTN|nr:3-carboxy-cis,cis-muconate cycloisomerase [Goekera deserti]NDI49242.1 3-carboxy-cis,cis-muconate cycloisomerase [Goekera deserti]NEL52980.1 3-carboxy-cis,cis-muconate cycloisomerase [Goekera deserti]